MPMLGREEAPPGAQPRPSLTFMLTHRFLKKRCSVLQNTCAAAGSPLPSANVVVLLTACEVFSFFCWGGGSRPTQAAVFITVCGLDRALQPLQLVRFTAALAGPKLAECTPLCCCSPTLLLLTFIASREGVPVIRRASSSPPIETRYYH